MEKLFELFYLSSGICTDTRKIEKDCLFICIKGENFDGNQFASNAKEKGAKYVIVDDSSKENTENNIFFAENSVIFLQKLANFHRKKFNIPVIGITGSNGKTTSKELIYNVLSKKHNVLATIGNLNNHLGVPFTLLRLNASHEIAIIEMGANRPKDIQELCEIAEPTHGIITNIGKAHLEGFVNFEGVLKTKTELYESVEKSNGTIVFNADDETLKKVLPKNTQNISYGKTSANILGELVSLSPFVEMKWNDESFFSETISTQLVGEYNFYNFLAAVCFGKIFDVPNYQISEAIESYTPTNNRSQVKKTNSNTLILDCYNANPTSMKSAIESFQMIASKNKLLILGDMKELGNESEPEHQKVIDLVAKHQLKTIVIGECFSKIQSSCILKKFSHTQEAKKYFNENKVENQLILLKGSRSIELELLEGVF